MIPALGFAVLLFSVIGGFLFLGGPIHVLWQPFELLIVGGAAVGAFLVANPRGVLRQVPRAVASLWEPKRHDRAGYLELLAVLYAIFRLARQRGWMELERHFEDPLNSPFFQRFPRFYAQTEAMQFLCDYLRILSLGQSNAYEIEALMDEEIETLHAETLQVPEALRIAADGLPALGIIGAVLGVIKSMRAIDDPAALANGVAAALVGTFLGVALAYGFVGPVAAALRVRADEEIKYYLCMKAGILAFMQGTAPSIAVEFARKTVLSDVRPTFLEVETVTASVAGPVTVS